MYYLGKGTEFKKEECKEYKTLRNAMSAAEKDEDFTVWDESGKVMNRDAVQPEEKGSGQQDNGSEIDGEGETAGNGENGNEAEELPHEHGKAENEANTVPQEEEEKEGQQDSIVIIQGMMKATVVCDGALNIRRSPAWGNKNICGRAVRGQSYYVKEIHTVDGKKMVRTIDDLYISGQPEHVKIEQM